MLTHFKKGMAFLNPSSSVQISMDGPNVNWKFFHNLFQERKGEELPACSLYLAVLPIYIGSSSLHVVHGRFGKGAKEFA